MRVTLKAARVNKGFTQPHVAEKMGWNTDKVKYIEKNSQSVEYATLLRLCDLYDCTVDDIFLPIDYPKSEVKGKE